MEPVYLGLLIKNDKNHLFFQNINELQIRKLITHHDKFVLKKICHVKRTLVMDIGLCF